MFQDIDLSRDTMASYSAFCSQQNVEIQHGKDGGYYATKRDIAEEDESLSVSLEVSHDPHHLWDELHFLADREPETAIQVLTTGFWPSCPMIENLMLPTELIPVMTRFDNFYRSKYSGRRLQWAHALGRCVVVARFKNGSVKKELEVSFFQVWQSIRSYDDDIWWFAMQALVLLCFKDNSVKMLPFEQIK